MNRNTFNAMAAQYTVKTVIGKNLCDVNVSTFNATAFWDKDDVVEEAFNRISLRENTQYTVSWDASLPEGSTAIYYIRFAYTDGTSSAYGGFHVVDHRDSRRDGYHSITSVAGKTVQRIIGIGATAGDFTLHWLQVEEGSVATEYVPYAAGGEIRWNNGVRCVLPEVQIGGKVEQKSYKGYNRLQLDGKTANNEVTVSYDPNTQILTLNGTKTLPGNLILSDAAHINWDGAEKFWTVRQKIGGNVTLDANGIGRYLLWSVFTKDSSSYTCRTRCTSQDESSEFVANVMSGVQKIEQSPAGSGYRILLQCLGCSAENPIVFDNYQVRLMITETDMNDKSVPTEYEPYIGGVPAPNPQCPIMPVISEGTEVVCCSKNLFDVRKFDVHPGKTTEPWISEVGDTYIVIAEPTDYTWNGGFLTGKKLSDLAPYLLVGKTYTLFFETPSRQKMFYLYGSNRYWYNSQALTITDADLASEVQVYGYSPQHGDPAGSCRISNIQIEEGTGATAYIPYHDGGTAVAPALFAIPDTEYVDTWNPQTGKGVRRCAVIESYAGEPVTTPYVSSTGELSDGAYVIYGIADTPFQTDPQPLTAPHGAGQIVQTGGTLDGVPITVKYVTHS